MLRRYAPRLQWPIFFATEYINHPITLKIMVEHGVQLIVLPPEANGFLESRAVALSKLPPHILYVLPLQEDFLLDRKPMYKALVDALTILDTDRSIGSLRLMPCPGPQESDPVYTKGKQWKILTSQDEYIFTYQATLWRRMDLLTYYTTLLHAIEKEFGPLTPEKRKQIALNSNIGENRYGQTCLQDCLPNVLHLAWPREGKWSNAVYLCPWPYRPTAVTRGNLEAFAEELFQREGVKIEKPKGNILV
jgi:hypothetical protein